MKESDFPLLNFALQQNRQASKRLEDLPQSLQMELLQKGEGLRSEKDLQALMDELQGYNY